LNFLSINKERLLIGVLGPLCTPDAVRAEILSKAARDERFRAAARVWPKLTPRWIEVLSDEYTPELNAVVRRITLYARLRGLDDGLPPIDTTNLLSPIIWPRS